MEFALFYAGGAYDIRGKLMGRQSAGQGFLKAAVAAKPRRLWCYASTRAEAQTFGRDVLAIEPKPPELRFIDWSRPDRLAEAGLLYRPDPGIAEDAWRRRTYATARAYSLCGVTHTLSSHAAMTTISGILAAPLYSWDAIVCTSTAARDVFKTILDQEADHLRARIGATRFELPQLPLIPLGTHVDDFTFDEATRAAARDLLGLGPEDVAVLFAGRLVFHGKGHPLPMFVGLDRAAVASGRPVVLVLFGQFPNDHIAHAFRAEAAQFAPSVRLIHLDGAKPENRDIAWAAADIFTSMSDNIQETFGLTPVEAMAAGLPVVVSDWNGYKDTVRDGVDGFRVPTLMCGPGHGDGLAEQFNMQAITYDKFIGVVSQFTAVDIDAAAAAFVKLIGSPDLRRQMGAAGHARARALFDWPVVFQRYVTLWDELAERRRADPRAADEDRRTRRPDRLEPFTLFRTFPTSLLNETTPFHLRPGATLEQAVGHKVLASVSFAEPFLPSHDVIDFIVGTLTSTAGTMTVAQLQAATDRHSGADLSRAVVWLCKMGSVTVQSGSIDG